jgi:hypothetical protein
LCMAVHNGQTLTTREMVRAHPYPVLATLRNLGLVAITVLQIPNAVLDRRYNRCVDVQMQLDKARHLGGQDGPGKLLYLEAVQHCEGH